DRKPRLLVAADQQRYRFMLAVAQHAELDDRPARDQRSVGNIAQDHLAGRRHDRDLAHISRLAIVVTAADRGRPKRHQTPLTSNMSSNPSPKRGPLSRGWPIALPSGAP